MLDCNQGKLAIAKEIEDRRKQADAWFNSGLALEKLEQEQDAIGAYRNARELYQVMGLDADVQICNAAIQQLKGVSLAVDIPAAQRNPKPAL
jgi:hypothetical protein